MEKAQYAIMRFAKYKGPEIGNIEAHNERTKEKYASNPDVDASRSKYNFHLVKPPGKYRAESERQIAAAGCRTRKDSIRMIETLFTASPEFFKGKKRAEIRVFFEEALHFLESEGYIRLKADASISSKDCYDIYRMWCEENSLTALKRRSFSDALVAACGKYNLEHCNTITNSAGRRVWGFMGIEAVARPHINEFTDALQCTYVPEDWRD